LRKNLISAGLPLMAVLFLTACGKAEAPADQRMEEGKSRIAGAGVDVASAPGVSLSYRYGFRLPVEKIAAAQEENASQCEALGPATCRITGMRYDVSRDRTVSASLEVRLAPEAARRFGKQSVESVARHGGMLAHSQIESEESGAVVAAAQADRASFEEQKARIEKQLAVPGLGVAERQQLQAQLADLTASTRGAAAASAEAQRKLAATPLTLEYESGQVDQSLSDGPIIGAFKDGWINIVAGSATIIMMLVTLLPWLLLLALAAWIWRRWLSGWLRGKPPQE